MKHAHCKEHWFWELVDKSHLYKTKAEAFFKAFLITLSWAGSSFFNEYPTDYKNEISTAFYLFGLSLIMEYAVKLIEEESTIGKLYPFLIIGLNAFVAISAFTFMVDNPFKNVTYELLELLIVIAQAIIWFDTIIMLWVKPYKNPDVFIENTLND